MAQVPQEFAADFALAARHWLATGQTDLGIEDIRAHIRADLEGGQNVAEWAAWVKCIADFQRGLDEMVSALNSRLRSAALVPCRQT